MLSVKLKKVIKCSIEMKAFTLLLLFFVVLLLCTACKTTESDNNSEMPWNAQRGWEHGLPSGINQGR